MKHSLKIFWMILGFLCLGFGTVGIVLPILPTVPFYMATLFCFAKSSERLHSWFLGTNLYKKHLDLYKIWISIIEMGVTNIQTKNCEVWRKNGSLYRVCQCIRKFYG